jgi:hypothetical protein
LELPFDVGRVGPVTTSSDETAIESVFQPTPGAC